MKQFVKRYFPIIPVLSVLVPVFFSPSCANTTQAPTGGWKDTIPPVLLKVFPPQNSCNVKVTGQEFVFTFDEYVKVKNPQNIFFSPPLKKNPRTRLHGKSLIVYFEEDTLAVNTTYTIGFSDALADNNEGNLFPGFTYVFSTGDHVDSLMMTGLVQDCSTLKPIKGATVMLYKDQSDSAIFKSRPVAATKTDDWGYFAFRNIQDTLFRMYAVLDENNDKVYNPENERVAFIDSLVRPVTVVDDSLPELKFYEMKDTLACLARKTEYELNMFREKNAKQYIGNKVRVDDRTSYITFMAPGAHIDTMWIKGVPDSRLITQFNRDRDSLEIWVNDRRQMPDTFHLYVNYLKTDTLGVLSPFTENVKLVNPNPKSKRRTTRQEIKHEDTICVFTLEAKGETIETEGFVFKFKFPLVNEFFDSLSCRVINPKQQEETVPFKVIPDSCDVKVYHVMPQVEFKSGYDYVLKVPANTFRDITGFYNDSTLVKATLPNDEKLSSLKIEMAGVENKYILDLQNEQKQEVIRSFIVRSDTTLNIAYLKAGKYCIRITEDLNDNSLVDTGNLLAHKQPEKVKYYKLKGNNEFIDIPEMTEMSQTIDLKELFK